MNPRKYTNIIDAALALEKKEPSEVSKSDIPVFSKLRKSLLRTVKPKRDARRVFAVFASALNTSSTILAAKIPLDELHQVMSREVHRIQAAAIMRGAMPFTVHCVDRFLCHFDFGHSRVLTIRVQLQPAVNRPTTASFIVEENFDHDEINFDLVPSINNVEKKEPTIQDAVIWPHDEFGK